MFYIIFSLFSSTFLEYTYSVVTDRVELPEYGDTPLTHGTEVMCKLQPNGYACGSVTLNYRFYYDIKMEDCLTAVVGNCIFSEVNSFNTLSSCQEQCREEGEHEITANMSASVFCRLQPDFGKCNQYNQAYYYDVTHRECRGFSWSGCGGNRNRFNNIQACSSVCFPAVKYVKKNGNKS